MSETHTLLSAALGKLNCGVLIIDSQRRICFINQWLLQALRHPALDYQGRPLLDVLPEIADSRLYKSIGQALDKGLPAVLSPSLNPYPLPLFNGRADDPERLPMIQSLQVMPLRQQGLNHCMIAVSDLSSTMRRENLLKVQAEKLSQQSLTDDLTSIANRRRLNQVLEEEVRRAGRTQKPLSVILLDIDHFKAYNDRFGHLAGDACLMRVAMSLQERVIRAGDLLARYGGEEFCVILPDTDNEAAHALAEALRHKIAGLNLPHPDSSCAATLSISLGVATSLAGSADTATGLLLKADNALYRAKQRGRNCSVSHVHIAASGD